MARVARGLIARSTEFFENTVGVIRRCFRLENRFLRFVRYQILYVFDDQRT